VSAARTLIPSPAQPPPAAGRQTTCPVWCDRDGLCEPGNAGTALHKGRPAVLGDDDADDGFRTQVRTALLRFDHDGTQADYVSLWVWDAADGPEPTGENSFDGWVSLDLARQLRDRLSELLHTADPRGLAQVTEPDETRIAAATEALARSGVVQHGRCREVIECAVLEVLEAAGCLPVPGVVSGDE
jgi:hypothetical protein